MFLPRIYKYISQETLKRRDFLTMLVKVIGIGIIINVFPFLRRRCSASTNKYVAKMESRLVTVFHPHATDGTGGKDNTNLNDQVVKQMVDEGIKAFTGKNELKEAWSLIIPDKSKKVAIKINCQIEGIYTKAKVVKPIVDGLVLRGVNPDNIIIYDKRDKAFKYAGFIKNKGSGVKVGTVVELGGYHRFLFNRLAKLLTGGLFINEKYRCEYLINVPVLKALDGYSGVTLSMKNHYGSIDNPQDHHEDIMTFLPYLNSLPQVRKKTRLIVMDAIFVEYKWVNGRDQQYVDIMNKILVSDDPVAIDTVGWKLIEEKRKEYSLNPLSPQPVFIEKAAAMGLGNSNLSKIKKITINLTHNNVKTI